MRGTSIFVPGKWGLYVPIPGCGRRACERRVSAAWRVGRDACAPGTTRVACSRLSAGESMLRSAITFEICTRGIEELVGTAGEVNGAHARSHRPFIPARNGQYRALESGRRGETHVSPVPSNSSTSVRCAPSVRGRGASGCRLLARRGRARLIQEGGASSRWTSGVL